MVYSGGLSSAPDGPSVRHRSSYGSRGGHDWSEVDWKISPERSAPASQGAIQTPRRGLWGRISRFVLTGLAALALTGNISNARMDNGGYSMPIAPEQTTHEVVDTSYRAGIDAPNSLWRIAEYHLDDSLPHEQPARDQTLIRATDALALENGMCPPSIWHAAYPNAGYHDALSCEDGSPSPHILTYGQRVSVGSITPSDLEGLVEGARMPGSPSDPIADDAHAPLPQPKPSVVILNPNDGMSEVPPEELTGGDDANGSPAYPTNTIPPWARVAGAIAGTGALIGLGLAASRGRRDRLEDVVTPIYSDLDAPFVDPNRGLRQTPHGNATLAYGHAYLGRKNYLDRTIGEAKTGKRLSGAARGSVERKAARLNRLAAALDAPYVNSQDPRSIGETVRESLGLENLTDRTAKQYVRQLATLGHTNAQAYVTQMPNPPARKVSAITPARRTPRTRRRAIQPRLAFA